MPKRKSKAANIISEILSALPFVGFVGLAPAAAIVSVVWVVVTGTTPDIFPFWTAVSVGAFIGIVALGVGVGVASRVSGDAFPDFVMGFIVPCGIIIIVSCVVQPVAARMTHNRLKQKQSSVPTQMQQHVRNLTNKRQNKALHPTAYSSVRRASSLRFRRRVSLSLCCLYPALRCNVKLSMIVNMKKRTAIFAFLSCALTFTTPTTSRSESRTDTHPRPDPFWITPEAMLDQGFSIVCEFRNVTAKEKTTKSENDVIEVKMIFDKKKGPQIKRISSARMGLVDGEKKLILSVPIEAVRDSDTKSIRLFEFAVRKSAISNTFIDLSQIDTGRSYVYVIPLKSFYEAK